MWNKPKWEKKVRKKVHPVRRVLSEFRTFALYGRFVDLAFGVVLGGVFNAVVSAFSSSLIMPWLGLIFGKTNLTSMILTVGPFSEGGVEIELHWGAFVNAVIVFFITALAVFFFLKLINRLRNDENDLLASIVTIPLPGAQKADEKAEEVEEETEEEGPDPALTDAVAAAILARLALIQTPGAPAVATPPGTPLPPDAVHTAHPAHPVHHAAHAGHTNASTARMEALLEEILITLRQRML